MIDSKENYKFNLGVIGLTNNPYETLISFHFFIFKLTL